MTLEAAGVTGTEEAVYRLLVTMGRATAREVAQTGVDYLAVGALTHSSPVLDIGLDLRSS